MRTVFALVLAVVLATAPAEAQRVQLAGKVTASRTVLGQRRVGEARYVAISDLFYRDRSALLEVLDLETRSVIQVEARRATLERRFGVARDGVAMPPLAEIVRYRDGVMGIAVTELATGRSRRVWYAELDAATGKLGRSIELARLGDGDQLQIVGADAAGDAAWFAITDASTRGRTIILRRLELAALDADDVQRVALAPRSADARRDHAVRVHAAPDFSRFAVVEYVEDNVGMAPGKVHIVDVLGGGFAVPAPPTVYGVAFSPDGKYVYLGSAQRGTISRIDVDAGKIDRQVAGPHFLHHLVVSPGGTRLFAFATSNTYAVYDLPDLRARVESTHPAGVAAAMSQLSGNGVASLDGAWFVVPEPEDRRRLPTDRTYLIARLSD